jgi:type IV secretion system protein VirB3
VADISDDDPAFTLFVACTRPALKLGAPIESFGWNAALCSIFVVVSGGNIIYGSIFIPIHVAIVILTEWEPNFFNILKSWMDTNGRAIGRMRWRGSRLAVAPCGWPKHAWDLSSAIA